MKQATRHAQPAPTVQILLTPTEAAARLRVKRGVLYTTLRQQLPWLRVGKLLRIGSQDLEVWLENQREQHAA